MLYKHLSNRILSILLAISMMASSLACASASPVSQISDPDGEIISEQIDIEQTIVEEMFAEHVTSEIYLEELIVIEDKISELLLSEKTINEVILCKTVYVSDEHIEEFSRNSQTTHLFGDDINIKSLLTKISVGTGVIVTVCILSIAGLAAPVASIVTAAASESLKFAAGGAIAGSLVGGLTGATDVIDETGRISAVMGFAIATVGLIISAVSLATAIPSMFSTTITAAAGIKLVLAGVSVAAATAETAKMGNNVIKSFTSTDAVDIDWDSIDWEKVGVSTVEKAINFGADGYMWGSIIGAVYGGIEGYDFYQKFNTPYSDYNNRLVRTPVDDENGHWKGKRGESDYIYDKDTKIKISDKKTLTIRKGTKVTYKNAVPDFSPFQKAQVKIQSMTNNRTDNFKQADEVLADYWTRTNYNNKASWTKSDVKTYRTNNNLTWHEMNNMESMQLVPTEINAGFTHSGGIAEYNAMIGTAGVTEFD